MGIVLDGDSMYGFEEMMDELDIPQFPLFLFNERDKTIKELTKSYIEDELGLDVSSITSIQESLERYLGHPEFIIFEDALSMVRTFKDRIEELDHLKQQEDILKRILRKYPEYVI